MADAAGSSPANNAISMAMTHIPVVAMDKLLADPHGVLRDCRSKGPVVAIGGRRVLILHARNVMRLMSDPRAEQIPGEQLVKVLGIPDGITAEFLKTIMLMSNGADHVRRRGAVNRIFAQPVMRAQRDGIRNVVRRIVGEMPKGTPFDFVEAVAALVPAQMIATILGLPLADVTHFRKLVYSFSRCLSAPYPMDAHNEIDAAGHELFAYVSDAIETRRQAPRDDLLTALATADSESALGPRELAIQVVSLILAGSDTTRAGIAMTLSLLLQHPEQWAKLKSDASLIPSAVAEALRFEPPIGSLPRFCPEPFEIDGVAIPGNTLVALSTLSAMRDDDVYPDPDRFDITRKDGPRLHMVFGGGPHRCLGEMLARIEMEETVAAIIATAPEVELVEPARIVGFGGIRSVTPMIVRIPI